MPVAAKKAKKDKKVSKASMQDLLDQFDFAAANCVAGAEAGNMRSCLSQMNKTMKKAERAGRSRFNATRLTAG